MNRLSGFAAGPYHWVADKAHGPLWLSPGRFLFWHLALIAVLLAGHLSLAATQNLFGRGETLWRLMFLGGEANLPSFVSAVALLLAGVLAALLALVDEPRNGPAWWLCALILTFLALDEAASIHEQVKWFFPREPGTLSLYWILPYGAMALAVMALLLPFWWRLPRVPKLGLAVAALLYVAGALGMELVEGSLYRDVENLYLTWPLVMSVAVEEVLEMGAVALAIFSLLTQLSDRPQPVVQLSIGPRA